MANEDTRLRVAGNTRLLDVREKIRLLEVYAAELEKHAWHTGARALWPNVSAEQYARDMGQRQGTLAR